MRIQLIHALIGYKSIGVLLGGYISTLIIIYIIGSISGGVNTVRLQTRVPFLRRSAASPPPATPTPEPLEWAETRKEGSEAQHLDVSITKSPHSSHRPKSISTCLLVIEQRSVTGPKLKSRRVKLPRRLREAGRSRSRSFPLAISAPFTNLAWQNMRLEITFPC
jgi:hypothetical protein